VHRNTRRLTILAALLLLLASTASAQGRITGVIRDTDGHPIKGASITAESPNFAATSPVPALTSVHLELGILFERRVRRRPRSPRIRRRSRWIPQVPRRAPHSIA
jgi:hypothetical protein